MKLFSENFHNPPPPLHDPPHPFMTYPSPTWPTSLLHYPPHPFMNQPPLYDLPQPYRTQLTPSWTTPPHPFMTHPTLTWHTPTPPLHDPPHPTPMWPKWWTPSCMVSQLSLRPWGRVWSKQPGGGTGQNFKIEGEPMCKFLVTLDTFVGLNG